MERVVIDAGPFIHLNQIGKITLLKRFSSLYTPASVAAEISVTSEIPIRKIQKWKNLRIISVKERNSPEIERTVRNFRLHIGERDVLYIACTLASSVVLTDDLAARSACESLEIEVHGTIGVIAYAFHHKWISLAAAEKSLLLLSNKSSLFITSAIIERAMEELKRHN